jgi:hypothetical protein
LLFHWILLRRLQRLLLLRSLLRCLLRWHLIMRRLLPVCKLRQRLLLLLHPRRLRGLLLLLLRRLLRRQLLLLLLRRTLLLQWQDIAYILLETVHSFCLLPLLLQTLLLQHKLQCLALLLLRLLQLSLRC